MMLPLSCSWRLRQRWPEPNRELLVGFAACSAVASGIAVVGVALAGAVLPLAMAGGSAPLGPQRLAAGLAATDRQHAFAHRFGGFAGGGPIAVVAVALARRWPRLLLSACGLLACLLPPPLTALLLLFVLQPGLLPAVLALGLQRRHLGAPWPGGVRRLTAAASASAIGWRQSAAGVAGGWFNGIAAAI